YQNRPRLFDLQIQLPELLYRQVIEVDERLNARGEVLQALDTAKVLADLQTQYAAGYRAIAIVLMHAWCYPQHEAQIAE
ncbi:hydantoinase/oxoprolinase N-terminal domain-containing protein, partial [Acinetobacter baumannii]